MAAEQPGEVIYHVLDGAVKIHVEQLNGRDVILAILGPGEIVGEMTLMDRSGRSANVVTLQDSVLLWMSYDDFRRSVDSIPEMGWNLMRILSGRLRRANERIQRMASLNVSGRVACEVLALAEQYGQPTEGGLFIPLRLTQGDIASLTGASRERVNQAMSTLRRLGQITVGRDHRITVSDVEALARMGGGQLP